MGVLPITIFGHGRGATGSCPPTVVRKPGTHVREVRTSVVLNKFLQFRRRLLYTDLSLDDFILTLTEEGK